MTLEELLTLARIMKSQAGSSDSSICDWWETQGIKLANAVAELLVSELPGDLRHGDAHPAAIEEYGRVGVRFRMFFFTAEEARAIAVSWLRAADQADELKKGK